MSTHLVSSAPRRLHRAGLLLVTLMLAALGCPPPRTGDVTPTATATGQEGASEAPPEGRLPAGVTPTSYALELHIDPALASFTGRAAIAFRAAEPRRTLWLHARDLKISAARIASGKDKRDVRAVAIPGKNLLRVDLGQELAAGDHVLELEYDAHFASSLSGLYRVEAEGRSYAFTQFEALDARRAFPCFDEPGFKTPFDVTLVVPEGQVAIANTSVVEETKQGARKRVRFATTKPLPTYLVAFAVGPFDVVDAPPIPASAVRKTPLPLRGVAVKGKGKLLADALKEHARVVNELERYFEIAYPYDKLDIIAVPDFAAGAMENAGAITYREAFLLIDPATASEQTRRDMVGVAAHELAHQWFGNLVTLAWWDDLWLNEAFATWMGQRVVGKLYPAWNADLELMSWVQDAMESDSLVSARSIRQKITGDDDVENAFDDLTYSKGAGLIAMFERFVGEEPFRAGVRRYLEKFRFGSATTSDFMAAVFEGHAQKQALIDSFVLLLDRPGVPRVSVEARCKGNTLEAIDVAIERFLPVGSSGTAASEWRVPLCVRTSEGSLCDVVSTRPDKRASIVAKSGSKCPAFVFPNADGAAYVRYTPSAAQAKELFDKAFAKLSTREKLAAVDALRAGFRAGTLEADAVLAAYPKVFADPSREVTNAPGDVLTFIATFALDAKDRAAFATYATNLYGPAFRKLGWAPKDKSKAEPAEARLARRDALEGLLFIARDPATRKEAVGKTREILGMDAGGALKLDAVPAEILGAVLSIGVKDGGEEVYDAMLAALKKTEDGAVRRSMLNAIAGTISPKVAVRARSLVHDPAIRAGELLRYVINLMSVREVIDDAWTWLEGDMTKLVERLPESVRGYLPMVVEGLCEAGREEKVRALFAPHLKNMPGAPRTLENAIEKMRVCDALKAKQRPAIVTFLEKRSLEQR